MFNRTDDRVSVKCKDLMSDEVFGDIEDNSFISTEKMLSKFLIDFIECARQRMPAIRENIFFKELSLNASTLSDSTA